jgi:hypothetical protein
LILIIVVAAARVLLALAANSVILSIHLVFFIGS